MDATLKETILRLWRQGSNTWVIAQRSGTPESDVIDVVKEEQVVGHKTFRNKDGIFRHEPLYESEAKDLMARIEAAEAKRNELMPDEDAAIRSEAKDLYISRHNGCSQADYLKHVYTPERQDA